jgi:phosphatidyl-myo-inositol dimannoside synthase
MGTHASNEMKKVALFTLKNFNGIGGIEKVGKILMKVFSDIQEEGHIQFKSYSAYDQTPDERYIKNENFRGFNGNKVWFTLRSFFNNLNADVIILSHINLSFLGLLFSFFQKKKVIIFAHGIEVWQDLNFIKKTFLKRCDRIIAVSHYTKQQLIDLHHIDPRKITVLNNCIDPYLVFPQKFEKNNELLKKYNLEKNDFVLFTLARLALSEKYKGYDKVIEAIGMLKKNGTTLKYLIAGKYDDAEKNRINNIIKENDLNDHVFVIGYINEEELADHFLLADCFVMPSKKEGFGIVFCEAMVYGLPVIAGNKDGSVDALRNGEMGTLIDPDSTSEISKAIDDRLHHKNEISEEFRKRLSLNASNYFGYTTYKENLWKIILN